MRKPDVSMSKTSPSGDPGIPGSASSKGGDRNSFISQIETLVNDNLSLVALDVGLLADRMCMSRASLYRRMMEHLGMGANEYIRMRRMEKVAARLRDVASGDTATISDISFACGFSSHAAFAKAFRKHFGISASEYIASCKQ